MSTGSKGTTGESGFSAAMPSQTHTNPPMVDEKVLKTIIESWVYDSNGTPETVDKIMEIVQVLLIKAQIDERRATWKKIYDHFYNIDPTSMMKYPDKPKDSVLYELGRLFAEPPSETHTTAQLKGIQDE